MGNIGTESAAKPASRLRAAGGAKPAVMQRSAVRFACIAVLRDPSRAPRRAARFARPGRAWPLTFRCASPMCGDSRRGDDLRQPAIAPAGWRSPCAFRRAAVQTKSLLSAETTSIEHLRSPLEPQVPTRQHGEIEARYRRSTQNDAAATYTQRPSLAVLLVPLFATGQHAHGAVVLSDHRRDR